MKVYNDEHLYHYGVLGMKWGVRKGVGSRNQAIKEYNKKYNSASRLSELADNKWKNVKAQRKKLGKNRVTRTINAIRGKSLEAKKYNKMFDEASKSSDLADKQWKEAKEAYKKTGMNVVSRVINNVKYDLSKNK